MNITSDPKCENCSHPWSSHFEVSAGKPRAITCQVRRAKDWDEQRKVFKRMDKCDCPTYRGARPVDMNVGPDSCPHEFLPGSNRCIHCKRISQKSR